ncbi:hypothetical protein D1007_47416 [Hordeum vulgare]|nr:hypothetical protein D1007_47416 [Hordeum vulgare]
MTFFCSLIIFFVERLAKRSMMEDEPRSSPLPSPSPSLAQPPSAVVEPRRHPPTPEALPMPWPPPAPARRAPPATRTVDRSPSTARLPRAPTARLSPPRAPRRRRHASRPLCRPVPTDPPLLRLMCVGCRPRLASNHGRRCTGWNTRELRPRSTRMGSSSPAVGTGAAVPGAPLCQALHHLAAAAPRPRRWRASASVAWTLATGARLH